MDWAIDKISQQTIHANSAIRVANRYVCPVCGADCTLRKGRVVKPYFAHNSGIAPEACENYHPGNGIYSSNHYSRSAIYPIPKLYIHAVGSEWFPEILVYDYPLETGEIYIPFGMNGYMKVFIPRIKVGGERIAVKTREQYFLQTSDDVIEPFKHMICSPIDGLNKSNYNFFNCTDDRGIKLHTGQQLIWGNTYYVVWHLDLGMAGWLPNDILPQEQLKVNYQWFCKKISLPKYDNQEVQEWIFNKFKLQVRHTPIKIKPVFPIPDQELGDGSYLFSNTKLLFFSIDRDTGSEESHQLEIFTETLYSKKVTLSGEMPIILALNPLPLGRTHLIVDEDSDVSLKIYHTEKPFNTYRIPGVEFIFNDKTIGTTSLSALFSPLIVSQFNKVLHNDSSLEKILLPKGANGSIYSIGEEDHQKVSQVDAETLKQQVLSLLGKEDFVIDFGNYGKIEIRNNSKPECGIVLKDSTRNKLKWINKQLVYLGNGLYPMRNIKGLSRLKGVEKNYVQNDGSLIEFLFQRPLVPTLLIPYIKQVVEDIASQDTNQTKEMGK